MGEVLLQAKDTPEAWEAEGQEKMGGKCGFNVTISGLCLQLIAFISQRTKGAEKSMHSYVGEAATL